MKCGKNTAPADFARGLATAKKPAGDADILEGLNEMSTGLLGLMSAAFNDALPKQMFMGSRFSFGLGGQDFQILPGVCKGQSVVQTDVVTDRGTMSFKW